VPRPPRSGRMAPGSDSGPIHRVVFDTNVFVRSLINPHGVWGRLVFGHADSYELVVSEPIVREVIEVLRRPELTRKFRTLAGRDMRDILDKFAQATVVDLGAIAAVARDPKDDPFLATAAVARARFLVTEDKDLLVLEAHRETQILDAASFLRVLETGAVD
jgi:uncharacterized protein